MGKNYHVTANLSMGVSDFDGTLFAFSSFTEHFLECMPFRWMIECLNQIGRFPPPPSHPLLLTHLLSHSLTHSLSYLTLKTIELVNEGSIRIHQLSGVLKQLTILLYPITYCDLPALYFLSFVRYFAFLPQVVLR